MKDLFVCRRTIQLASASLLANALFSLAGVEAHAQSPGTTVEVILSNIPGAPTAQLPGYPGFEFDRGSGTFGRVYGSPNGNWILRALVDGQAQFEDEVLIVNGQTVYFEGLPVPWDPNGAVGRQIVGRVGINTSGDFAFVATTSGGTSSRQVVSNIGGEWRVEVENGGPSTNVPKISYSTLDSALITESGRVGFSASSYSTGSGGALVLGGEPLALGGETIMGLAGPATLRSFIGFRFHTSADAEHWIVTGSIGFPSSDCVIMDGNVVIEAGFPVPGSGFIEPVAPLGANYVFMDASGRWFARGTNSGSAGVDWVVRDGAVITASGMPIHAGSTEVWLESFANNAFLLHAGNTKGDYVLGGRTDATTENRVLTLNGSKELLRTGAPLDIDLNGLFDDDAYISDFGVDSAYLTDDLTLFVVVRVRDGALFQTGEALLAVRADPSIGSTYCVAESNSSGNTAAIQASGSVSVADSYFRLTASSLPPEESVLFLVSLERGFSAGAFGSSNGNLCLSGTLGRFNQRGQVQTSSEAGTATLDVDLLRVRQGGVFASAIAGETWNFQAWFTDGVGLGSNFTDAVEVLFYP